jgi:hypothetical protein
MQIQLHDGVISHAAARKLDEMQYRLDNEGGVHEGDEQQVAAGIFEGLT